jgi:hypothetical protein
LGFINDAHPAATQPLDDAVVRDDLANHWRESYVGETCKSMKPVELVAAQRGLLTKNPDSAHCPLDRVFECYRLAGYLSSMYSKLRPGTSPSQVPAP